MISMVLHVAVILILAAWNVEPIQKEIRAMMSSEPTSDAEVLDEFSMDEMESSELVSTESEESPSESPSVDPALAQSVVEVSYTDVVASSMPSVAIPSMTQSLIPKNGVAAQANVAMRAGLNSRSKETKRDLFNQVWWLHGHRKSCFASPEVAGTPPGSTIRSLDAGA